MTKKESLPDRPKFCRSGSAVRHLFEDFNNLLYTNTYCRGDILVLLVMWYLLIALHLVIVCYQFHWLSFVNVCLRYISDSNQTAQIILGMGSGNERMRCIIVTASLIGRAHSQNHPWTVSKWNLPSGNPVLSLRFVTFGIDTNVWLIISDIYIWSKYPWSTHCQRPFKKY